MAVSPTGKALASASFDKTARLWNAETGAAKHILSHDFKVRSVQFSPNGTTLVTGSVDGTITLWHVNTGEYTQSFRSGAAAINCLAYSPDGKTLISSQSYQKTSVWSTETDARIDYLDQCPFESVNTVSYSPDGKTLASDNNTSRTVLLWSLEMCKRVRCLPTHTSAVCAATFSPNGKTLASCSGDATVCVCSLLDYDALCRASPLLRAAVAPYVVLDVINFLVAQKVMPQLSFCLESAFLHSEKIFFLEALQKRNAFQRTHWQNLVC